MTDSDHRSRRSELERLAEFVRAATRSNARRSADSDRAVGCPDLETLAAFVDRRLPAAAREAVEAHLADCDRCRRYFVDVSKIVREVQSTPGVRKRLVSRVLRFLRKPKAKAAGGGLLALAASVSLWVLLPPEWNPFRGPTAYEELVAAMGTTRPVDGRLTGFRYGELSSPTRAAGRADADFRVLAALARLRERAEQEPSPQNLRAIGVGHLVVRNYDAAIAELDEAASALPNDPALQSDLAVALLSRASYADHPEDFPKALAAIERALKAEPSRPEVLFNHAVVLEHLELDAAAAAAWRTFLEYESEGPWADEARRREATLRKPRESSRVNQPTAIFEEFERLILVQWPSAIQRGDAFAALQTAKEACSLAAELRSATGDELPVHECKLLQSRRGRAARLLADAFGAYRKAKTLQSEDRILDARDAFVQVHAQLQPTGSAYAHWAELHIGIGEYYDGNLDTALSYTGAVSAVSSEAQFILLEARARRMAGLVHMIRGRYLIAAAANRAAQPLFRTYGDISSNAAVAALLADAMGYLGARGAAWKVRREALALARQSDERTRHIVLVSAGSACERDGQPHAALRFFDAAISQATKWGNAAAIAEAHLNSARPRYLIEGRPAAVRSLVEAEAWFARVPDRDFADRWKPDLLLLKGEILESGAEAALQEALQGYAADGARFRIARLYLALARVHLGRRNIPAAETALKAGLLVLEDERRWIDDEMYRITAAERAWALYSELARLYVERGDYTGALNVVERARARALREALQAAARSELVARPGALERSSRYLYLLSMEDRFYSWLVGPDGARFFEQPLTAAELTRMRKRLSSPRESPDTERDLFKSLIQPFAPHLGSVRRLLIVPDEATADISFARLRNPETSRYLIEDFEIAIAPSMSVMSLIGTASVRSGLDRALVIADPAPADGETADLPRLPAARREAQAIARVYPVATVLTGGEATKAAFLTAAADHDIIHFAGHALVNTDVPALSRLVFASNGAEAPSSALLAGEVPALLMNRPAVVVLAACRTADGYRARAEGVVGLARYFLAAGVPSVVATFSDIEDRAASVLFAKFHGFLRESRDPAVALRAAQLEMLHGPEPALRVPSAWASTAVFGGARPRPAFITTGLERR